MKSSTSNRVIIFTIILLITSLTNLIAQTNGKIEGQVFNSRNEPIPGVSVSLEKLTRGISTNVEGRFTLPIAAGTYSLTFTSVGHASKNLQDIKVEAGQTTDLSVILEDSKKELEQVTVKSSSSRKETVNAMIAFQRNTSTVSQVISAEAIRRSPDKTTGEVLKRVPGTSIQEGKYLVVRGLSDRYNQAMLNGILLNSTEPDRKTFSFDIFPSAMIDNIIINKSFIPN